MRDKTLNLHVCVISTDFLISAPESDALSRGSDFFMYAVILILPWSLDLNTRRQSDLF